MIRAHMATFPTRSGIYMQTVETILPQVDLLCICLNEYDTVPPELADHPKIEAMIPDRNLKDAGKFAFQPGPDDFVVTIDDDILYPPDYVARMIRAFDVLDPGLNVVGFMGTAWVYRKHQDKWAWRIFPFDRPIDDIIKVDVLGTGTTCMLGRVMPGLDVMVTSAGFVDLRHARLQTDAGRSLWVLPRDKGEIVSNMRHELWQSSLFKTVSKARPPIMMQENRLLMQGRSPHSGLKLERVLKRRANEARRQASQADPSA